MCGSSDAQNNINQQQQDFYKQLQDEYSKEFQQNQDILDQLSSALKPIIAESPSQPGYSPEEMAALNTEATESAAMGASQAKQAIQQQMATDNPNITSGAKDQIEANIDVNAEKNLANEKLTNLVNSYRQGNQNYEHAIGALSGVPAAIEGASSGVANTTTNAGNAAANEANQINESDNSWMGLLGGLGAAAINKVKF